MPPNMNLKIQHGEKLNTATHAVGCFFSIVGSLLLLWLAASKQDSWRFFSFSIYAFTMTSLYLASTVYHGVSNEDKKKFFRKLDYIGIYLKIAGSYTPYMLLVLRGKVGWMVLGIVWTLAVMGIFWELFVPAKSRGMPFIIYGVMAVTVLPILKMLMDALPPLGFALVLAGYACYGIGCYFFFNDEKIKHGHGLWHMCVMAGTSLQFLCVLIYLA